MADWPAPDHGYVSQWTTASADGRPAVLPVSGASIGTKGSWLELISATTATGCGILIAFGNSNFITNRAVFLDIGIGAGGSEQVLVPDLWFIIAVHLARFQYWYFTVEIPKGSRISARIASSATSAAVGRVYAAIISPLFGAAPSSGPIKMYGGNPATIRGKALPITVINAENAWAELSASTACIHRSLTVVPGKDYTDIAMSATGHALDLGIGAAGVEVEIVRDVHFNMSSGEDMALERMLRPIPVQVPKGSRLAMRARAAASQVGVEIVVMASG
jgi:hypothetical protein